MAAERFGAATYLRSPPVAAALLEIGKQDMESPTKAGETMLLGLALAQKMGKIFGRCAARLCKQASPNRARGGIG